MYLLNLLRRYRNIFDDPSKRLLRIQIDSGALVNNIQRFRALFPKYYFAAVLKSNAYGHGLKEIGRFLEKRSEVDYLVVDSIIEAKTLRDFGIKKPVIILGYVPKAAISSLRKIRNVIFVINSKEQAELLQTVVDFKLRVHIKVDTGMNRQGIDINELEHTLKVLSLNKHILIEGMISHLADADGPTGYHTHEQIEQWKKAMAIYKQQVSGYEKEKGIFHFAATAGARYVSTAENNLIRVGIGLYGFDTTQDKQLKVTPVLSFWAKIINIKEVKAGEKIGYNFTFTASKDMRIAVIPCGYYEGVPRSLSNKGKFYFNGNPLPILGRVSMNLTVVDISDVKAPINLEDEVEVYSTDVKKDNSVENVAKLCDTIPYEILVRLAPTIKRTIK